MGEFRKLSDTFYASPQVSPQDISEAAAMGMAMCIASITIPCQH